jgi:hypothetical protein
MKQRITLNLRDDILRRVFDIASRSDRDPEQILEDWIARYADDLPVEALPDDEVLRLCEFEINIIQKQELRKLLYIHHDNALSYTQKTHMDELLQSYRRSIIRQARAIQVASARGLIENR